MYRSVLLVPVLVSFIGSDAAAIHKGGTEEELLQENPGYPVMVTEAPKQEITDLEWTTDLTTLITRPIGTIGSKTIIAIEFPTDKQEQVFLRGGYTDGNPSRCLDEVHSDPCAIPIRHIVPEGASESYSDWADGDVFLDLIGREETQGGHNGTQPLGTPMRKMEAGAALSRCNSDLTGKQTKTTRDRLKSSYWLVELDMDCSDTYGYFEVKVIVKPKNDPRVWMEKEIEGKSPETWAPVEECVGGIGSGIPFYSDTHIGRCGLANIFGHKNSYCEINKIID